MSGILQEATPGLIAMRNVLIRIAVWASAGFLISLGWGFYFANTNKDIPIEPTVHTLAGLMQPIVVVASHRSTALGLVVVANAATYALVGLIVETVRKHRGPLHTSH